MKHITLITGGIKSGKSTQALRLAAPFRRKAFIATAEAFDEGMKTRIACHREERSDDFTTMEEPLELAAAIQKAAGHYDCLLIDCLTLWLNNLYHHLVTPAKIEAKISEFLDLLPTIETPVLLVTNEIGFGLVPADPAWRRFTDDLGRINQRTAGIADEVIFMVCGLAQHLKGAAHASLA